MIDEIDKEAALRRETTGSQVLGAAAILKQNPIVPRNRKVTGAAFHVTSKRARRELCAAYAWFVQTYREASKKLPSEIRDVAFPTGSLPPALPFVAA